VRRHECRSEVFAVGLPEGIDAVVASLLTHMPAAFTFATIEAEPFVLSSGSFLWHAID